MENDDIRQKQGPAAKGDQEALQRENEALDRQVKRLIRAEGRLYEYQQELDAQLKEYKGLYDLNRRLNGSFDITHILHETVAYITQELEYERAIFLRRSEGASYRVCALDGFYEPAEMAEVAGLVVEPDEPCLAPLLAGKEYMVCLPASGGEWVEQTRARLHLNEYFIYPLSIHDVPEALLVVGNSSGNAPFYRRVEATPAALLTMGNLIGLISSLIDNQIFLERVTRAREQERAAEARYRSIFENAAEGIYQRCPDGRFIDANPALAHMLGYASPAELMTEVIDIQRQLYTDQAYHDELVRQLEANGRVDGFEAQMRRKDGSIMWVSLSMRQVRGSNGKVLFYEGMSEEITQRKMAEDLLRESERQYRELSEALEQRVMEAVDELRQKDKILILQGRQAVMGEMLSNIAHQWRQPLNLLALQVQDLQMTQKSAVLTEEYVEKSVGNSMRIIREMSRTIDDFRYFFMPDKEKLEFRISEPLARALSLLEGSFKLHGIRVEVDQTGDPAITGYLGEFIQVLLNILINAREALAARNPPNPFIRITLLSKAGRPVVSIADNAGGIPEEIKDRIFEPYFTTKGPEQGTGIGLFMCKTIIEKSMKGVLSVHNTEEGAEFIIEL